MKYHVGDIVVGNDDASTEYFITKKGVVCKVLGSNYTHDGDERIRVEIISGQYIGHIYEVNPQFFDLVRRSGVKLK